MITAKNSSSKSKKSRTAKQKKSSASTPKRPAIKASDLKEKCQKLNVSELAAAMGVNPRTVYNWRQSGAPLNDDGSYSLPNIWQWHLTKTADKYKHSDDTKEELERQRIAEDVEFRKLRNSEKRGKLIAREEMNRILSHRAMSLKQYLTDAFMKNIYHFEQKEVDELKKMMQDFLKKMIEHYINAA
jgi:phage terminase Nu1 subunit (DNA packaging protein)